MIRVYASIMPGGFIANHDDYPNDVFGECPLAAVAELLRIMLGASS